MSADYRVGYKKPPTHTQFRKGQSGNPAGRPKGAKSVATVLEKILNQKVQVREGDKIKLITKVEAMIQSLIIKAIKGDARAVSAIAALARQTGLLNPPADELNAFRGGILRIVETKETQEELEERLAKQQDELQRHHRYVNYPKS